MKKVAILLLSTLVVAQVSFCSEPAKARIPGTTLPEGSTSVEGLVARGLIDDAINKIQKEKTYGVDIANKITTLKNNASLIPLDFQLQIRLKKNIYDKIQFAVKTLASPTPVKKESLANWIKEEIEMAYIFYRDGAKMIAPPVIGQSTKSSVKGHIPGTTLPEGSTSVEGLVARGLIDDAINKMQKEKTYGVDIANKITTLKNNASLIPLDFQLQTRLKKNIYDKIQFAVKMLASPTPVTKESLANWIKEEIEMAYIFYRDGAKMIEPPVIGQ